MGYAPGKKDGPLIITANEPAGLLYGTFHLLRDLQAHGEAKGLPLRESPDFKFRLLNHWDNLDRTVERGYAGFSIWDWHRLPEYIDPRYRDYARANASIGINGTVVTNVNANAKLTTITPALLQPAVVDNTSGIDWDGQNIDLLTQGHTANFLVGATLPVVSFYGGVGISITQTNLKANGYFPVPALNTDDVLNPYTEVTNEYVEKEPLDIEIKNTDGGITAPRLNAGMRLKFTVVTIHADYTWANYSVVTVGLGISFR